MEITLGSYELGCDNCVGGNVEMYITEAKNIVGYNIGLVSTSIGNGFPQMSQLDLAPGTMFYKVEFVENELNFKEPFSIEGTTTIWKPEYEIDLGCRSSVQQGFLLSLAKSCQRFCIIHKERAATNYYIQGFRFKEDTAKALSLISGESGTGKIFTDKNNTVLKFGHKIGLLEPAVILHEDFEVPL